MDLVLAIHNNPKLVHLFTVASSRGLGEGATLTLLAISACTCGYRLLFST